MGHENSVERWLYVQYIEFQWYTIVPLKCQTKDKSYVGMKCLSLQKK